MTEEVRPPTGGSAVHEADTVDAHDASAISVLDTGGSFSGTEVEAVLAEIWAGITAGGIPATIFDAAGDLIVASAADTAVRLPMGTALQTLRVNAGATALEYATPSGGADWAQDVNESGASFANYTAASGTWASNGTVITQTNTAVSVFRARYNTLLPIGLPVIYEAEVMLPSAGQTTATDQNIGILMGFDGTNTGGIGCRVHANNGGSWSGQIEVDLIANRITVALGGSPAYDTWFKVRALLGAGIVSMYVDGVLLGSGGNLVGTSDARYVGLYTRAVIGHFRNIKLWTLRTGIPA